MQASCHTGLTFRACAALIMCVVAACSGKVTGGDSPNRIHAGAGAPASPGSAGAAGESMITTEPSANIYIVGNGQGSAGRTAANPMAAGETGSTDTCASGMQSTSPVTPTVWLVVDGSTSMNTRSTLMDAGGVVDSLQAKVRFGLVIYAGGDPTDCVQLVTVQPALNNLAALAAQYPMNPLANGTPTDKALDYVVNNLPVLNTGVLDATTGPTYVVLATDGQPNDNCGTGGGSFQGTGVDVEQRVVDVTEEGTRNGMQMFVISLAGGDTRLQSHLERVAGATASKTPPYAPSTRDDLIMAFEKVIGGASCLVSLDGKVDMGKECSGNVRLNSVALSCNQADGWKLFDPSTVQLTGTACDTFLQQQSMVIANFPCEVFSPN
jgi:Mg-chelatase subunit ChlD